MTDEKSSILFIYLGEKCLKEVRILQSLHHSNIVNYLDSFVHENHLVIVLDWCGAGDLKRQIRKAVQRNARFSERVIWKYFSQIVEAVRYMHSKRVMHRDLKPANILLTEDAVIKVGDLGLGRMLGEETMQAFSKVGTPLYMAPEVLKGNGYDFSSDIWSLGCILYELACLISPFKEEKINLYDLFQKINTGIYKPLPDYYSEELRKLVTDMIIVDPSKRPQIDHVCDVANKMFAYFSEIRTSTVQQNQNNDTDNNNKNNTEKNNNDSIEKNNNDSVEKNNNVNNTNIPIQIEKKSPINLINEKNHSSDYEKEDNKESESEQTAIIHESEKSPNVIKNENNITNKIEEKEEKEEKNEIIQKNKEDIKPEIKPEIKKEIKTNNEYKQIIKPQQNNNEILKKEVYPEKKSIIKNNMGDNELPPEPSKCESPIKIKPDYQPVKEELPKRTEKIEEKQSSSMSVFLNQLENNNMVSKINLNPPQPINLEDIDISLLCDYCVEELKLLDYEYHYCYPKYTNIIFRHIQPFRHEYFIGYFLNNDEKQNALHLFLSCIKNII